MASIEKVLVKSEENIRALFDSISTPTYVWQKVGDFFQLIDYNNAAYDISQGALEKVIGMKASELYRERSDILEDLQSCFKRKYSFTREMKYYFNIFKEDRDLKVKYVYLPPDMVLVHTADITEFKNVEKKIQYQSRLVEDVSDAIISTDLEFNIKTWNKTAEVIYGWKAEETIGKNLSEVVPVEYPYNDQEVVLQKFFEEGLWKGEVIQKHKNGKLINILTSVSMIKDINEKPVGIVAINKDISKRKTVEDELYNERDLIKMLLGNHPDFIYFKDKRARFQHLSKRFSDFFGRSVEEIIGKMDLELFPEEIAKQTYAQDLQVIKTGIPLINHEEYANGIWVLTTKMPWIDKDGNVKGLFGISRDITKRKLAEQKLRESEEKFRRITEESHLAICILQDNAVKYANQRIADLYEYTIEEILNWNPGEFTKLFAKDSLDFVLEQARKKQVGDPDVISHYLIHCIKKSGELFWVDNISKSLTYNGKPADLITLIDITERKNAEQKLKESEQKFRTMFEAIPDIYFLVAEDTKILDYRAKEQELFVAPNDFLGKRVIDVVPPSLGTKTMEMVKKTIKTQEPQILEYELKMSDKTHSYEARYFYFSKNQVSIFIRDISERKEVEKKLKESEKNYRDLYEQAPNAYFSIGVDKSILRCNKVAVRLLGYTKEEFRKMRVFDLYANTENGNLKATKLFSNFLTGENIEDEELQMKKKSGDLVWVSLSVRPIFGQTGNVIESRSVVLDINERKMAEEKLRESEEKYRSLFNNMNAGFAYHEVIVDDENKPIDYKFIEANPAFEKLTGLKASDIIGKNVTEILPGTENDPADWIGKFGNVGLTGIPITIEDYSEAIDRWFKVSGYSPKKGYFAVTFTDITERQNSEQNLKNSEQKYREAFDQAMFYKDLFTHDMNNILSVLNSSAELITHHLGASTRSKEIENIAKIMKTQVERGSKLISNVRTLSELDKEESPTYPTKVCDLLLNAKNFVVKAFEDRNIQIKIDSFKKNLVVIANDLLLDVFENILINSIKYNENTNVDIFIRISTEQFESKNYIKIEFLDNGIGVPDDRKEIIFKPGNREFKGTKGMGLGLSLVSKILFNFKGKIWVEDKVKDNYKQGSNFIILLPVSN